MIPEELTGGWRRHGISLDGAAPREDSVVWWLQAPVRHADLRVPRSGAGTVTAFHGVTEWDGTSLTWTREVDLEGFDGTDTGTTGWDGADLLETGTTTAEDGSPVSYVERWVRIPGSSGPLFSERDGALHVVRAGDVAITMLDERDVGGALRATAWERLDGDWQVHHTRPGVPLAPPPA